MSVWGDVFWALLFLDTGYVNDLLPAQRTLSFSQDLSKGNTYRLTMHCTTVITRWQHRPIGTSHLKIQPQSLLTTLLVCLGRNEASLGFCGIRQTLCNSFITIKCLRPLTCQRKGFISHWFSGSSSRSCGLNAFVLSQWLCMVISADDLQRELSSDREGRGMKSI